MIYDQRVRLYQDIFAPQKDEKVLFLVDQPHGEIIDNSAWQARRMMANMWYHCFQKMRDNKNGITMLQFDATGRSGKPLPDDVLKMAAQSNIVIAMTEYSGSASLKPICDAPGSITRCASMPGVTRAMEETGLAADYTVVKRYALALEQMLNETESAVVLFSRGDRITVDLRYRKAKADTGECRTAGQFINLPSGEAYKSPYEAVEDERAEYGVSKTEGFLPFVEDKSLVVFEVKHNNIADVITLNDALKKKYKDFFSEDGTRRNIAEFGVGCNPMAKVSDIILESEKAGIHIAYGSSSHLGGFVSTDVHHDIVYAKGSRVEASLVTLIDAHGKATILVKDGMLRYELFK